MLQQMATKYRCRNGWFQRDKSATVGDSCMVHSDEAFGIRAVCLKRDGATGRSDMVSESEALS
jgi:hypothetical protein